MNEEDLSQRFAMQASLSDKQQDSFNKFKQEVSEHLCPEKNYLHEDYHLRKWLTARRWNVEEAKQMFLNNVEFRKKMNVEEFIKDYQIPEAIENFGIGGTIGFDRHNSLVVVEKFGNLDMKGLMHIMKCSEMERWKIFECEGFMKTLQEQRQKTGKHADGLTVIFDMKNVTSKVLWRPGLKMYLHLIKMMEDNYPEILRQLIVINAPKIFPILYKICKPMISEDMIKRIFVFNDGYKSYLLNHIDAKILPKYLGGERTDADGNKNCVSMIRQGGNVPLEKYATELNHQNFDKERIKHGDTFELPLIVDSKNSIIKWEFRTNNHDVGFGIKFAADQGDKTEKFVIEIERKNCHLYPEDGSHICKEKGIYTVVFDNSFSVARAKDLEYHLEVLTEENSFQRMET